MKRTDIVKIIAADGITHADILIKNAENETHPFLYPVCGMKKGAFIIVDFGKEICGRLHVAFGWHDTRASVRIRLGESVAEACAEIGENNADNHHSLRDNCYAVVSWGDVSTSESGFRFARIDNLSDESVRLALVYAEESDNGLTIRGNFVCSDDRLNEIYKTAERTVSLCVRDNDIWDGVKRDRVFWMGDFYPELLAADFIYGNIPQFEKVLNKVKYFDGHWVNDMPSYSAWWIICLEKYLRLSDNECFVKNMMPYVDKIVNDFSVIIGKNGEVSYKDSRLSYFAGNEFFFDWPTNGFPDRETGWRYLILYAMKCAENLYLKFGGDTKKADDIIESLDGYDYKQSKFKQVTALGVLAGKIPPKAAAPLLKCDEAGGMTTFMSFAIIEALRMADEGEFALSVIKKYFGAMLDFGATTFWEDFDMKWLDDHPLPIDALPEKGRKNIHADYGKFCYLGLRHSLCHGWSSGFIDFFYSYILGVIPIENGYKTIRIEPHLCRLTRTEGKIPTKYGVIEVKHEIKNGEIVSTVSLPDGVKRV